METSETAQGKATYLRRQRDVAERSNDPRGRLLAAVATAQAAIPPRVYHIDQ